MFVGDAFAELGRRSARRKLRRDGAQHELARQQALATLAENAAQAGVLQPAEQQALGQVAGQAGGLAQHVAALQNEIARLEAQRNAMIQGNAPQPAITDVDKTLYRLRGELTAKASHSSAATAQRTAVLAQIGGAIYARGATLAHVPALQPHFAHIAQIDHALATTAQQLQASVATSAAAPKGAIGKLFGAIAVVGIGGIVVIAIATSKSSPAKAETTTSTTPATSSTTTPPIDAAAKRMDPIPPLAAEQHVSEDGVQRTVKLYMSGDMARSEGQEDGKPFVIIVRHDRHVIWILAPETQTYVEEQLPPDLEAEIAPPKELPTGCLSAGPDKVAGYKVMKLVCETKFGGGKSAEESRWVAEELGGLVVKSVAGTTTMELADIKLGPQDPALFELPAGYHQ